MKDKYKIIRNLFIKNIGELGKKRTDEKYTTSVLISNHDMELRNMYIMGN